MAYTNPGVYVSESPFATTVTTGPTTTAAAFLGTAFRGPTTPTLIDSWNAYKSKFGDISSAYDLGYAVYHFFANGGRTAYVARVVGASAIQAEVAVTGSVDSVGGTLFKVKAANPGTWGNSLIATVSGGLVAGTQPSFNIVVTLSGAEVERWSEVSLNPDDSRYLPNVVNTYSSYIEITDMQDFYGTTYIVTSNAYSLASGADGASLSDDTNGAVQTAWSNTLSGFDSVNGQLLFNLVGKSNPTMINSAITYVEGRGNSFLLVDPSPTATSTSSILSTANSYTASSYAAVYYPMVQMSNPATSGVAALRTTYPCGAIAGLYSRVDTERSVAKAPAGYAYDLRNVFGLTTNFTESEVGTLYAQNINTLKAVPGAGVVVNGARTLKKTDITKYVPVRRSLNFIKANVDALTQFAVFEPNGERLWADITAKLSNFLSNFWSNGGLKGRSASEAFFVTCNSTNNTSATIEQGEVHIQVGVALQAPAEFIVITLSQFIGGNNVQETL